MLNQKNIFEKMQTQMVNFGNNTVNAVQNFGTNTKNNVQKLKTLKNNFVVGTKKQWQKTKEDWQDGITNLRIASQRLIKEHKVETVTAAAVAGASLLLTTVAAPLINHQLNKKQQIQTANEKVITTPYQADEKQM